MPIDLDTRALRVLHVVTDRDRRGAQVFACDLAHGLSALGTDNEVAALAPGLHGDLLPIEQLGPTRRSWRTMSSLRRRARSCDVVVAHGSATLLACAVALAGLNVPFVYRQISDPLHWAAGWSRRVRVALLLRRAERIVSLSDTVAAVLRRHYALRADRIEVIPNAVPAAPFQPATHADRQATRARFGLAEEVRVALYVGALVPEKGVDLAVRAIRKVPGAVLLIVGGGPQQAALARLADEAAPGQVVFTGPIDDPVAALHAGDVLMLPSRGGDSMPAVLIEAGLCGVPAITTAVGAITDVVRDGETGLVVEIDDQQALDEALTTVLDGADELAAMAAAARRRCSSMFTIEAIAPRWLELLTDAERPRDRGRPSVVRRLRS